MKKRRFSWLLACALTGAAPVFGSPIYATWTGSSGRWNDPAHWSEMTVPNGPGAFAEVVRIYSVPLVVALDRDVTLGHLRFSPGPEAIRITGAERLFTFQPEPGRASEISANVDGPNGVIVDPRIASVGKLEVLAYGAGRLSVRGPVTVEEGGLEIHSGIRRLQFGAVRAGLLDATLESAGNQLSFAGEVSVGDTVQLRLNAMNQGVQFLGGARANRVNVSAQSAGAQVEFRGDLASASGAAFNLAGASVKIARLTGGDLQFNDYATTGTAEIGIGAGAGRVDIDTRGTLRLTAVEGGYSSAVYVKAGKLFDVVADLSRTNFASLSTPAARLSPGGKLSVGGNGVRASIPDISMAGGELTANSSVTQGALKLGPGKSVLTVSDAQATFGSFGVSDRTGVLLVRGQNLGLGGQRVSFTTAPTLIGAGTSAVTTGILPNVVFGTSATGAASSLATYTSAVGIRALTSAEYSSTIASGANVRVAGPPLSIPTSASINSLTLFGGTSTNLNSNATLTIASGMILAAGGSTSPVNLTGIGRLAAPDGYVHFYTVNDLSSTARVIESNTLVKSGAGKLTYTSDLIPADFVVNEGTLSLPWAIGYRKATVRSGGQLATAGAIFAPTANIAVEKGGRWEIGGGTQSLASLAGEGVVHGVGPALATFRLSPAAAITVANSFTGALNLAVAQKTVTLTGHSSHTGATEIGGGATVRLGVDDALSAASALTLDGTLDLDGRGTTVAGLKANAGTLLAGSGGVLTTAPAQAAVYTAENFTVNGNLLFTQNGPGRQEIAPLVSSTASIGLRVLDGTLTFRGENVQDVPNISGMFVGGHGTLVVNSLPFDGFTTLVEAGAKVTRTAQVSGGPVFSDRHAVNYRLTTGRETAFQFLSAEGGVEMSQTFSNFQPGATVSDVLQLSISPGPFVLQIGYDPAIGGGNLADLRLGWFSEGGWIDATTAGGATGNFVGFESWDLDHLAIGDWGVDPEAQAVWAVLDRSGDFAVIAVPEGAAAGYLALGLGAIGWAAVRRRRGVPR